MDSGKALEQVLQTLQLFIPATGIGAPVVLLMVGWYYSFLDQGGQAPRIVFRKLAWRGFWMLAIGVVFPICLSSAKFWLTGPASRHSPTTLAVIGNFAVAAMLVGIFVLILSAARVFRASPPGTNTLGEEEALVFSDSKEGPVTEFSGISPKSSKPEESSGGGQAVSIEDFRASQMQPGLLDASGSPGDGESEFHD